MRCIYKYCLFVVLVALAYRGVAYEGYNVMSIPPALLDGANAVVRYDHYQLTITSLSQAVVTEEFAITILNRNGDAFSNLTEYYNQLNKIVSIEGTLYDKDGNEVRKLKREDVGDYAQADGFSLYTDDRKKVCHFNYAIYPYTVVYKVREQLNNNAHLPSWYPLSRRKCATEEADFNITYPINIPVRYRAVHVDKPGIGVVDGMRNLQFAVQNKKATTDDDFAPEGSFSHPCVIVAMDTFRLTDYDGEMKDWLGFGKFFYDLNKGRDSLPAEVKNMVHRLTDTCHTRQQKIDVLYQYLKENTRYVSIQVGIGGWQCFDALSVAQNGYGDCKALSNYMMALLKEAGITSYTVLIKGDENFSADDNVLTDFPADYFNHVILCAPEKDDTTWIECTAKVLPAGYLSEFTSNRDALVLMPDGGHLMHTPVYKCNTNMICKNIIAHIDADNNIQVKATALYQGYGYDREYYEVTGKSKDDVNEYLNGKFNLPDSHIEVYSTQRLVNSGVPALTEQMNLAGSCNVSRSGSRLFVDPEISKLHVPNAINVDIRTQPFELKHTYQISDTETVTIDGNYTTEYLPEPISMSYPFASYRYKISFVNSNTLQVVRSYEQHAGIYPARDYNDFAALTRTVNYDGDQKQAVLLKKE